MAKIVGSFCIPHNPLTTSDPDAAPQEKAHRVKHAYEIVRRRIEQLQADVAIIIGDDHYAMFHPSCQPRMLIGVGEIEGPFEPENWLKIAKRRLPNHPKFAAHVMNFGFDCGFDWAVSKSTTLDHSVMVPVHFSLPVDVKIVPIYISSGMEPIISAKRCRELGEMIGNAVNAWEGPERIVIIGTGGISHWVGMSDYGRVNENFDRKIMKYVSSGAISALMALSDCEVIEQAGNGALEIRNWIVAMSCAPHFKGTVIDYIPVPEWICGYGFVEFGPE